jgi:hypothetical protein
MKGTVVDNMKLKKFSGVQVADESRELLFVKILSKNG